MLMMPVVALGVECGVRAPHHLWRTVSASVLFVMAGWNRKSTIATLFYGRILQSFGLAFLFIPINVSAFAYVPREQTNMGTGIINLARNIGASVGIASVTTLLERRTNSTWRSLASM